MLGLAELNQQIQIKGEFVRMVSESGIQNVGWNFNIIVGSLNVGNEIQIFQERI